MKDLDQNKKNILNNFAKFVIKELKIKTPPTIIIKNNKNGLKTTANYDYKNKVKIINILKKNRALVDVLRSIGHELTHHKQFEDGRLKIKPPDIGGEIENEANAKAGQFIKMFSKKEPSIYEL